MKLIVRDLGRQQKTVSVKNCLWCGLAMERKRFGGIRKRLETVPAYENRKYCDRLCAAKAHVAAQPSALYLRNHYLKENCEVCMGKEKLQIHHKDVNRENNHPENLMTLCDSCHRAEHVRINAAKGISTCFVCGVKTNQTKLCCTHQRRLRLYGHPLKTKIKTGAHTFKVALVAKSFSLEDLMRIAERFPIDWTDLAPSETQLSPNAPRSPSSESSSLIATLDNADPPDPEIKVGDRYLISWNGSQCMAVVTGASGRTVDVSWEAADKHLSSFPRSWVECDRTSDPWRLSVYRPLESSPENRLAKHLFGDKAPILGDKNRHPLEWAIEISDRYEELISERDRLLEEGYIAPDDCWLETGRATKTFIQCWYRSKQPIFNGRKSRYVGREDSPEAKEARRAIACRNRLRAIAKELKLLEKTK